jgi:predicted SAM-dependent methyltransferase
MAPRRVRQKAETVQKLNAGCGEDHRNGWLDLDVDPDVEPDAVWDLEETPWPFADNAFTKVLMDNVLEHIRPRKRTEVINESRRVTTPTGEVIVRLPVPEVGAGWDLTHQSVPSWRWPLHPEWQEKWKVRDTAVSKVGFGRLMPAPLAKLATRFWVMRCLDEVELRLQPTYKNEQRH